MHHRHPHRVWPLQGASNFRDLGGYVGAGGRALRWQRLFRSDHLAGLTAADHAALRPLGLARALDFRGVAERAAARYELPGAALHSLAIEPVVGQRLDEAAAAGEAPSAALAERLMRELYRALVNDSAARFAEFFCHVLEAEGPLVFHCTAGKDRTGLAAALLLLALGVPRATVMQDYLLTNEVFRFPPLPADPLRAAVARVTWGVQAGFLETALDIVEREHGGVEQYLGRRIGLTPAARRTLAERCLEPAADAPGSARRRPEAGR